MLPAPCRWYDTSDGSFLDWNCMCIGWVKPAGDRFETMIQWRDHRFAGTAGSLEQGRRFVTRWVEAREQLPRVSRRR